MKKLIGIILAVSMAMVTVACGATESDVQPEPVQTVESEPEEMPAPEVSEPAPEESPNEETEATEVADELPESVEEDKKNTFNWLDYKGKHFSTVEINKYVDYDEPKVFYISTEGNLEAVLSNDETYVEDEFRQGTYIFYVPEEVSSLRCFCDKGVFEEFSVVTKGAVASGFLPEPESGEEIMFFMECADKEGNFQSVRIFITREAK